MPLNPRWNLKKLHHQLIIFPIVSEIVLSCYSLDSDAPCVSDRWRRRLVALAWTAQGRRNWAPLNLCQSFNITSNTELISLSNLLEQVRVILITPPLMRMRATPSWTSGRKRKQLQAGSTYYRRMSVTHGLCFSGSLVNPFLLNAIAITVSYHVLDL